MLVRIGVDVGGTNTDAVVLRNKEVIGYSKKTTTSDITSGLKLALVEALNTSIENTQGSHLEVERIHIGTTHFINAVIQKKGLVPVAVIRLCGTASHSLPPFSDFPEDLKQVICASTHLINGGYNFDGSEISSVDLKEINEVISVLHQKKIKHVVVSGIFSPVCSSQEENVKAILLKADPGLSVTLSHTIGQIGILERENAAILNESLKPLSQTTVSSLRLALNELGLLCPFFLTQNDGTLISTSDAELFPITTFASGPTNSMRGATYLTGIKNGIVVDIGGTTTDVGLIIDGFPREASSQVKVGGVSTNFPMPDIFSFGLGGGSLVSSTDKKVGPLSVGFQLSEKALIFGGSTLTASDIAVSAGFIDLGRKENVGHLEKCFVEANINEMHSMIEDAIDQVKICNDALPIILVGGGAILVSPKATFSGVSEVLRPQYQEVANAVGAAISQVSGQVDSVRSLMGKTRKEILEEVKEEAVKLAIASGANPNTIQVVQMSDIALSYLPGNASRIKVKVIGDLLLPESNPEAARWTRERAGLITESAQGGVIQTRDGTGESLTTELDIKVCMDTVKQPIIDQGFWYLRDIDIECIAIGAGVLGCGGGGKPHIAKLRAKHVLEQGHKIRIISPERMADRMRPSDRLLGVAHMGAPTIGIERLVTNLETLNVVKFMNIIMNELADGKMKVSGHESKQQNGVIYIDSFNPQLVAHKERVGGHQLVGLLCEEIGGGNSLEPLIVGGLLNLPVVDCDFMGRAFPELQMMTKFIDGLAPHPAVLVDHAGRCAVVLHADEPKQVENHFRDVCIQMGCSAGLAVKPLMSTELLDTCIPYSMSRAWRLGVSVMEARNDKIDPVQKILEHENGTLLCKGKIVDVERTLTGGFAKGILKIEGFKEFQGQVVTVHFQNENLIAQTQFNGETKILACTPDLISIVDIDTGEPITTDDVSYGLRVAVLAMACAAKLRTPEALASVGPQAFKFPADVIFSPLSNAFEIKSVPPI